jgi:methyl-accepting chemotaxis protein
MLERLLYCAAPDPGQARKGRWLNRLLLSFIILGTLVVLSNLVLLQLTIATAGNSAVIVILVGLYALNRRGYVTLATSILLGVIVVAIIQAGFLVPGSVELLGYPMLLVIAIITTGIFLSWRWVLASVVVLSSVAVWYYLYSDIPGLLNLRTSNAAGIVLLTYTALILFVAAGALSWLSSRLIAETIDDLRRRNNELETAYQALAEQTRREHDLGANINELATQLSAVSTRQTTGVSAQAVSIGEVVSAVGELHRTADEIAAHAQSVYHAAALALQSVQRGQDLLRHSREVVQRNRVQVHSVIERMVVLEQLTLRITRFVDSIHNLSDETHLLALNATIEAAGAGQLGRRFSVVAAEVQNLSSRSNEIVAQIRTLIGELRQAGEATLAATQSSIAVADEVEQVADEVREVQAQAVLAVQQTSELVQVISTATGQQTSATAQMTHTMAEIAEVAHATTHDASALERVTAELLQTAELLTSAMQHLPDRVTSSSA